MAGPAGAQDSWLSMAGRGQSIWSYQTHSWGGRAMPGEKDQGSRGLHPGTPSILPHLRMSTQRGQCWDTDTWGHPARATRKKAAVPQTPAVFQPRPHLQSKTLCFLLPTSCPVPRTGPAYRDFVLAREVGRLAEELGLGHGQGAGSVPNQHRVVQAGVPGTRREQVPAL